MTPRIIFLLLTGLLLSLCISPQKPETEGISLEELLPQVAELPSVWNITWSGKVNSGKAVTSLVYMPTGGRAWLWIYRDGNESVFNGQMGWGKAKGSLIKCLTYNGVYIYRYKTWMGYDRYLAHTGGYTFIFDSGEYTTDDYSVSGAPRDKGDKLFKLVLSRALEKGVKAEGVRPKTRETNLTPEIKPVEIPSDIERAEDVGGPAKIEVSWKRASLKDAVWNGEYWLITGSTGERGLLVKYDGRKFTDLSEDAGFSAPSPLGGKRMGSVDALAWNGSVWLIAGGGYCKGGGLLKSYEGERFVNLTPPPETDSSKEEFIHALRNISGIHCVVALAWNGEDWLLSSLFPKGRLIKYNGNAFHEAVELSYVRHIAWGDGYWMLVSREFYSRLIKYDGERLEDVTPLENISISAIAWNGSEWLITGAKLGEPDYEGRPDIEETFALRYDGSAFAKVDIPGDAYISSIAWTGRRWLLSGDVLLSYDGSRVETIALPESVSSAKVRWGGDYGLVIGYSEGRSRLFSYDGRAFKELTGMLYSEVGAVP
ncbi:hypothetical protein [Candidatus Pyrohabitans sp.]